MNISKKINILILVVFLSSSCGKAKPALTSAPTPSPTSTPTPGPVLSLVHNVIDANTTIDSLGKFCDTSSFKTSFYNDTNYGVGWGTTAIHSNTNTDGNDPVPNQMQCCEINLKSISHIKVRAKTRAFPSNASGYLYISKHFDSAVDSSSYGTFINATGGAGGFMNNGDAWGNGTNTGTPVFDTYINNLVTGAHLVTRADAISKDVTVDEDYSTDALQICISGDVYSDPNHLSKRYITEMVITTATPQ